MEYTHRLNVDKIETHNLNKADISVEMTFDLEDLKKMYKDMAVIRKMELEAQNLFDEGKIRGFCHLVTGQESIYAAYRHAADQNDTCTTSYRCHGLSYVTGDEVKTILAELMGRKDGMCGGKGGSMHLYNSKLFGGHGIVGAWVPIAVGTAFNHKYTNMVKGDTFDKMCAKNVAFTFYGDGAANQGQVFESFNMAGKWKLPVVFICENNEYGMWTPVETVSSETRFYKRGQNLPGICVSDQNIFDLIGVLRFAREMVLKEQPIVIEIKTYRFCTHSARDGTDFRSEVEDRRNMDVLKHFRSFLGKYLSEEELNTFDHEIEQEFRKDLETALQSAEPDEKELYTNVIQ